MSPRSRRTHLSPPSNTPAARSPYNTLGLQQDVCGDGRQVAASRVQRLGLQSQNSALMGRLPLRCQEPPAKPSSVPRPTPPRPATPRPAPPHPTHPPKHLHTYTSTHLHHQHRAVRGELSEVAAHGARLVDAGVPAQELCGSEQRGWQAGEGQVGGMAVRRGRAGQQGCGTVRRGTAQHL